jgi:hypothetical protein
VPQARFSAHPPSPDLRQQFDLDPRTAHGAAANGMEGRAQRSRGRPTRTSRSATARPRERRSRVRSRIVIIVGQLGLVGCAVSKLIEQRPELLGYLRIRQLLAVIPVLNDGRGPILASHADQSQRNRVARQRVVDRDQIAADRPRWVPDSVMVEDDGENSGSLSLSTNHRREIGARPARSISSR